MPVLNTKMLFEQDRDHLQQVSDLVKTIFPQVPPQAIHYEMLQQGLLQEGKVSLSLDVWTLIDEQLQQLKKAWDGPDSPVYILPIKNGFVKNGVAYPNGICLFISPRVTIKELHALFAHEYHHMCRRHYISEPPTLLDSLLMEGLAEYATLQLFGEHALSSWTKRYSLEEVKTYWQAYFLPALQVVGLHNHKPFLFGDTQLGLPPWIGYCTGYRIVEAYIQNNGRIGQRELIRMDALELLHGAGFI